MDQFSRNGFFDDYHMISITEEERAILQTYLQSKQGLKDILMHWAHREEIDLFFLVKVKMIRSGHLTREGIKPSTPVVKGDNTCLPTSIM